MGFGVNLASFGVPLDNTGPSGAGVYQPLDSDLTDIAALSPSNDDIIQRKAGAWTNRTPAQYAADLTLSNIGGSVTDAQVPNTITIDNITQITTRPYSSLTGYGTGVSTWLGTPTSANLASAITDETGSGALVFGTSPTFTTQITTPLITGGSGATDYFSMSSNTNTPNTVSLKSNSAIEMLPTPITRTSSGLRWGIEWTGSITMDYTNSILPRAVNFAPTITMEQSGSGIVFATIFGSSPTIQNASGEANTVGGVFVLLSGTTIRADGANLVSASGLQEIRTAPTITTVNSGTIYQSGHYGTLMTGTVSGDANLRAKLGHHVDTFNVTGNGIVNNLIAYSSLAQTAARDFNYAWKGLGGLMQHSDDFWFDDDSKGVLLNDRNDGKKYRLYVDTGALSIEEVAFNPFVDMTWAFVTDADAAQVNNVADLADVTRWNDKSGNARDLTIGSGADYPTWENSLALFNNQSVVEFTSANSQSLMNVTVAINVSTATDWTWVGLVSFKTVASAMRFIGTHPGNNARGVGSTSTPEWAIQSAGTAATGGTPATGTLYFVRAHVTSSTQTLYINEVSTATNSTVLSMTQYVVGAGHATGGSFANYFNGYMAFHGAYTGDITTDARWADLKTWLNTKYGTSL